MININKQGIMYASGDDINENIMPNSYIMQLGSASPSTGTWRLAGTSNMTRSRVLIENGMYGFQNAGIQTANDGSCYGIDSFPLAANTQYTISMYARIIDGTEGYAGYSIYSLASEDGGSHTKTEKNYRVTPLSTEWTRCWYTFTTNSATTRNIYIGITTGDTSVTTQMTRIKIEKGGVPTSWIPNPLDEIYTSSKQGYIETNMYPFNIHKSHSEANEFYEI